MEPRERIKVLAKQRFFSLGLTPVTMDKLAYDLGMSKKTLYHFYESKDDLLQLVLTEYLQHAKDQISKIQQKPLELIDRLKELWLFGGQIVLAIDPAFKQDLKRFHPELWQEMDLFYQKHLYHEMRLSLEKCIERAMLQTHIKSELLLNIYLKGLDAIYSAEHLDANDKAKSIRHLFDLIFLGALSDTSRIVYKHQANTNKVKKDTVFKRVSLDNRD